MKKIVSEKKLLKRMDIDSVDKIPEKFDQFIDLLPDIDKDLAMEIINQLPEYRQLCTEILKTLESSCEKALDSADRSLKRTVDTYEKILDGLNERLHAESISEAEKNDITREMVFIADKVADLHKEHQNFILKILAIILFPITIILCVIVALAGGKKNK